MSEMPAARPPTPGHTRLLQMLLFLVLVCGGRALANETAGTDGHARSERSRAQEKMLALLYDTTTGWRYPDTPEWQTKGWCAPIAFLVYTEYDCEVQKIRFSFEPGIAGSFPAGFWEPFQRSLDSVTFMGNNALGMSTLLDDLHKYEVDRQLRYLYINRCPHLQQSIPPDFEIAQGGDVIITRSELRGTIPPQLYQARVLNLSDNELEGGIEPLPGWRHAYFEMERLELSGNRLAGDVNLAMLLRVSGHVDLQRNGPLKGVSDTTVKPNQRPNFQSFAADSLDLSNYRELMEESWGPGEGWDFLESAFTDVTLLSVVNAGLQGGVPAEFVSKCFIALLLTNNSLSGPIPVTSRRDCYPVMELDVSGNDLMGHFPPGFVDSSTSLCDISGNRFLCPLPEDVAKHCTGKCAETCYNNGLNPQRGQPCQCEWGFYGDHCELYDLPGGGRLNCTSTPHDQSLALCAPLPAHCSLCQRAFSAAGVCSGDVIARSVCIHGQCEADGTGRFACQCDPGYEGDYCGVPISLTKLYAWLIVCAVGLMALVAVAILGTLAMWQRHRYKMARSQRDTRITELEEGLLKAMEMTESMRTRSELDLAGISVAEVLGEGASARVFLVHWQGKPAVLKQYRSRFVYEGYAAEREVFESLRHPNIVRYWGYVEEPPCILMEYCEGGSLYDVIHGGAATPGRHRSILSTSAAILMFALDIARGLQYLHGRGVVHRDIKSMNILVAMGRAKIADFDTARRVCEEGGMTMNTGTMRWMAPEVIRGRVSEDSRGEYGCGADIWSFGCVLWEMYSHEMPYHQYCWDAEIARAIGNGATPMDAGDLDSDWVELERPNSVRMPPRVAALLRRCWSFDPEARPTPQEVVATLEVLVSEG